MPVRLEVEGAGAFVDALSKFNKEVYAQLQKEVRKAAEIVRDDARRRTPAMVLFGGGGRSAGWGKWSGRLDWNKSRADAAMKVGANKVRKRGVRGSLGIVGRVYSDTRSLGGRTLWAFSSAGSKNPNSLFNRAITDKWGQLPTINGAQTTRTIGAALIEKGPQAGEQIDEALERAQAKFGLR